MKIETEVELLHVVPSIVVLLYVLVELEPFRLPDFVAFLC